MNSEEITEDNVETLEEDSNLISTKEDPNIEIKSQDDLTSNKEDIVEIKSEDIPWMSIKSIGDNRIKGRAILWGNETEKDLVGDWFDKKHTEGIFTIFRMAGVLPWLYEHGSHEKVGVSPIGVIDTLEEDDWGVIYEAAIKDHKLYKEFVGRLVEDGVLFSSSGALPGTRKTMKNGLLKSWVVAEVSGTVRPMDHRQLELGTIAQIKSFDIVEDYVKAVEGLASKLGQGDEESRTSDLHRLIQLKQNQLHLEIMLNKMEIV